MATAPGTVWSWDITYLRSPVRGSLFYLYLVLDVFSRKIVGAEVHDCESAELAAGLVSRACAKEGIAEGQLVIHSDNGAPMKGATMLATLQELGVATSFIRPSVSNNNPFSESAFRTLKYRPEFPHVPFESLEYARAWVARFVAWYNTTHLHSGIAFVTPDDRHAGRDVDILDRRNNVYRAARATNPIRWARGTRDLSRPSRVRLNPKKAPHAAGAT